MSKHNKNFNKNKVATENKTEEKTGMESFGSNVGFDEEIPF